MILKTTYVFLSIFDHSIYKKVNLTLSHQALDTSKEPPYNMIGLYNLDLTVAFTEKDKLLDYKWFALIDPDEPQEGTTVWTMIFTLTAFYGICKHSRTVFNLNSKICSLV